MPIRTPAKPEPIAMADPLSPGIEPPRLSRRQFLVRNLAIAGAYGLGRGVGETHCIEITRHQVPMPGLKQRVRVVQLTDLHRSWCVSESFLLEAAEKAAALRPDLVALTGDYVTHNSHYVTASFQIVQALRPPLGTYAVLGNHDYWCDNCRGWLHVRRQLQEAGAHVLINHNLTTKAGLVVVGVDDCLVGHPNLDQAFREVPKDAAVLCLTHNPAYFTHLRHNSCVTLAGHTHGGQISLPFMEAGLHRFHWLKGWYRESGCPGRLYISRGIGTVGIPLRFRSLPEIAVFDLMPA